MTFADELESLKGPLKLAAIDAYMRWNSFSVWNDEYRDTKRTIDIFDRDELHIVERPDANGEGGGEYYVKYKGKKGNQYIEKFAEIRAAIDGFIDPWLSLPETGPIETLLESLLKATDVLAPDGAEGGGGVGVHSEISEIERHLASLEGSTFSAYKSNFLGVLDSTSTNIFLLVSNAIAGLAAGKGAIEGAQQDVLSIVREATVAFESGSDTKKAIQVIQKANDLIKVFLPPQAKIVSSAGGAVFSLLEEIVDDSDQDPIGLGSGYKSVMEHLPQVLDQINAELEHAEREIIDQGTATTRATLPKTTRPNSNAPFSNFDLSVPTLSTPSGTNDYSSVKIDEIALEAIYSTYMPSVSSYLSKAAKDVEGGRVDGHFDRDGSLGAGTIGATGGVNVMCVYAADYLKDLAWETDFAAEQLRLVHDDFRNQDEASADALRKHEEEIRNNPYDPGDEYV